MFFGSYLLSVYCQYYGMVNLRGICSDHELAEVSFHLLLNLHYIMGASYDVSAVDNLQVRAVKQYVFKFITQRQWFALHQ